MFLGLEVAVGVDGVLEGEGFVDDGAEVVLFEGSERSLVHLAAADVDASDGQQVEHAEHGADFGGR